MEKSVKKELVNELESKLKTFVEKASMKSNDRKTFLSELSEEVSKEKNIGDSRYLAVLPYFDKDDDGKPTEKIRGYGFTVYGPDDKKIETVNASDLGREYTLSNLESKWSVDKIEDQKMPSQGVSPKSSALEFLDTKNEYKKEGLNLEELKTGMESHDSGLFLEALGKSLAAVIGKIVSVASVYETADKESGEVKVYSNFFRGQLLGMGTDENKMPVLSLEQFNKTGEPVVRLLPIGNVRDIEVFQAGQKFALHELLFNNGKFRGVPIEELKPHLPKLLSGKQPFIGVSKDGKPMLNMEIMVDKKIVKIKGEGRLQLRRTDRGQIETWTRKKIQNFEIRDEFAGVKITSQMKEDIMKDAKSKAIGIVVDVPVVKGEESVTIKRRMWFDDKCNTLVLSDLTKEQKVDLNKGLKVNTQDIGFQEVKPKLQPPVIKFTAKDSKGGHKIN